MQTAFANSPELVHYDGTYKILNNGMPVHILAVEDADGQTNVVGVGFVVSEDATTLKGLITAFKDHNPEAAEKIRCFMTDKDMSERKVIKELFPEVEMYICGFHVLTAMDRKVTQLKPSVDLKNKIMELLEKLVHSQSQEDYDIYYEKFSKTAPEVCKQYFDDNWGNIQKEWTRFNMKSFGNYTNNRLEGAVNSQIKKYIGQNLTLSTFIEKFFTWYLNKNLNYDLKAGMRKIRKPRTNNEDLCLTSYRALISNYAFKKLFGEYQNRSPMTLQDINKELKTCGITHDHTTLKVSTVYCSCMFFQNVGLPCRHIFACRQEFELELFVPDLCQKHWLKPKESLVEQQRKEESLVATPKPARMKIQTPKTPANQKKILKESMNRIYDMMQSCRGERLDLQVKSVLKWESLIRDGKIVEAINVDDLPERFKKMSITEDCAEKTNDIENVVVPKTIKKVVGTDKSKVKTTLNFNKNKKKIKINFTK